MSYRTNETRPDHPPPAWPPLTPTKRCCELFNMSNTPSPPVAFEPLSRDQGINKGKTQLQLLTFTTFKTFKRYTELYRPNNPDDFA